MKNFFCFSRNWFFNCIINCTSGQPSYRIRRHIGSRRNPSPSPSRWHQRYETHTFLFFRLLTLYQIIYIDFVIFASSLYLDWLYNRLLQPCRVRPPSRPVCGPLWQLPHCWPSWSFNDKLVTSRGAGDMFYHKAMMTWNEFMNFSI